MRIFGLKETFDASRESIGKCKGVLPSLSSPSTSFVADVHFQCCMSLQGTLDYDFDIFAALGAPLANLFKTN